MRNILKHLYAFLIPTAIVIAILLFLTAVSNVKDGNSLEDKKRLEESIARAAVSCYSIEGAYPPSLEYLITNYNIRYNEKKYIIKYELTASNLMPDITVLEHKAK